MSETDNPIARQVQDRRGPILPVATAWADEALRRQVEATQRGTSSESGGLRLLVTGWPRTGKTTLADKLGLPVHHTDDLKDLGWSEASEAVSKFLDEPGPWCIEGVAVPRALRKWLARNPDAPLPFDRLVVLGVEPYAELLKGQVSMGKGVLTVLEEVVSSREDIVCDVLTTVHAVERFTAEMLATLS